MKTIVKKRQYGSISYYEFSSFDEMMKNSFLSELACGDGDYGVLDIYTDDKDMLCEKIVYKDWYEDQHGNSKDKVYYLPNKSICNKYHIGDGGIEVYPLSELPKEMKERPVDNVLLSSAWKKPWNLE